MFEGLKKRWRVYRTARNVRRRLHKVGHTSISTVEARGENRCSSCDLYYHHIYRIERVTPGRAKSQERHIGIGCFCLGCGFSSDEGNEENLFHILETLEERHNPWYVTQGRLDDARRHMELLEEEVERKQRELDAARRRLQTLETMPLLEAKTYRTLPEKVE